MWRLPVCLCLCLAAMPLAALVQAPAVPPAAAGTPVAQAADGDLVEFVLRREAAWEPDGDETSARAAFDELVARCRGSLPPAAAPADAIATLNRVLLQDHLLAYRSSDYWRDARLSTVLLERRGNCWGLSLLYAAVGQRLGLPLQVVREPGHALVRWDDGTTVLDLETTALGAASPPRTAGPVRVLTNAAALRAEVLRLELQRWIDLGAADRAAATLEALPREVAESERRLWQARIEHVRAGTRDLLVAAARGVVDQAQVPFGLRAEALAIVAEDHLRAGRLEAADQALVAASPLVGQRHRAHIAVQRARLALQLGRPLLAEETARTALALDPDSDAAALVLGEALIACGRPGNALEILARARERHPAKHALAAVEAACLHLAGRRDAAAGRVAALARAVGDSGERAFNLAWFHAHAGDERAMRSWLARAVAHAGGAAVAAWIDEAHGPAVLLAARPGSAPDRTAPAGDPAGAVVAADR